MRGTPRPLVHLELHTGDAERACVFYAALCGWRPERIEAGPGPYLALDLDGAVTGGVVECPAPQSLWIPYVQVEQVTRATERARSLGATVLLEPREGPAGWRSVVSTPAGGELAFWQPKR